MIGFIMWSLAMFSVGVTATYWYLTRPKPKKIDPKMFNEECTYEFERHLTE